MPKYCPECDSTQVVFAPVTARWGKIVTALDYECNTCDTNWRDDEEFKCFECGGTFEKTVEGVVCRQCGTEFTGTEQLELYDPTELEEVAILELPDGTRFRLAGWKVT